MDKGFSGRRFLPERKNQPHNRIVRQANWLFLMTLSTFCRGVHAFFCSLFVTGLASFMESISCRRRIIFCPCYLMACYAGLSFLRVFILMVTNNAINFCLLDVRVVRECYRRHLSFQFERHRIRYLFLSGSSAQRKHKSTNKNQRADYKKHPHLHSAPPKSFLMFMVNQRKPRVKKYLGPCQAKIEMSYVLISCALFSSSLFLFGNRIINVLQGWFLDGAQLFFGLCAVRSSMGVGRCAISGSWRNLPVWWVSTLILPRKHSYSAWTRKVRFRRWIAHSRDCH